MRKRAFGFYSKNGKRLEVNMLKLLKYLLITPFALFFIWVLYLNLQLYKTPKIKHTDEGVVNQEVLHQLYHLKSKLDAGAAQDMQSLYPEGFLFLHALYLIFSKFDDLILLSISTALSSEALCLAFSSRSLSSFLLWYSWVLRSRSLSA